MNQDKIEDVLIVYKQKSIAEDRGFLIPLLKIEENNEFKNISIDKYPAGIYVSRGYSTIDSVYAEGELFLLDSHYFAEDEAASVGAPRYWTEGNRAKPLSQDLLVPIVKTKLPSVSKRTLSEDCVAPQRVFFIHDELENKLYGPVTVVGTDSENRQTIGARSVSTFSIGKDNLGVFDYSELTDIICNLNINDSYKSFILSLEDLKEYLNTESTKDYMSDSDLINYFNRLGTGRGGRFLSKNEARKLKGEIALYEKNNSSSNNKRLNRLKEVLDRYLQETDTGDQIIKDFFESSKGVVFLENYVENNESRLLNNQIKKIEEEAKKAENEINSKITSLEISLQNKQKEIHDINKDIDRARIEANKKVEQIELEAEDSIRERLKEKEEKLQDEVEKLERQKAGIDIELTELTERLGLAKTLDGLKQEISDQKVLSNYFDEATSGIEEALQNPKNLAKRMGELDVVSRILRGGNVSQDNKPIFTPLVFTSTQPSSSADIIDAVRSYFDEDFGKSFSEVEMANLLISITQSFLTVLAGPPGVGKTSSVVRLAEALRLGGPSEHKNFLYMSVARGWVSGRDILGFYNSLNNTYQRARTGLFDFLNRPKEDKDSFQLILLDEANLSPMEHYWSDFLGMCDKEGRSRPIETGIPKMEERLLQVKENVRFIATINHDSTTERLSPRLIDRVPVIFLDHDIDLSSAVSGMQLDGAVDYNLFEKYFITDELDLGAAHGNKLDKIIDLLRERDSELGQPISISHRKRDAITNYYSAAVYEGLMDADTAFDFAVSQHVLPHIEGYGSKFKNRILALQSELGSGYPRSSKHLERILASGNDFAGTYSFF